MRPKRRVGAQGAFVAAAAVLLAAAPPARAQCSMCKTVVTGSEEGRSLGGELNKAILIMVAAPYLVFGGFVAALFRQRQAPGLPAAPIRRERARVRDRGAPAPPSRGMAGIAQEEERPNSLRAFRSGDRGAIAQEEERPNSLRAFRTNSSGEDRRERPGGRRAGDGDAACGPGTGGWHG